MADFFIYGTLKRGDVAHHLLADQQFLGVVTTRPRYRLYNCGPFPGLVEDENGRAVAGELWRVDDGLLPALDEYEGDRLFRRQPIELANGRKALAYLFLGDVANLPDCGSAWPP